MSNLESNLGFGLYKNPPKELWPVIMARPSAKSANVEESVRAIMRRVAREGDSALREYTKQFDGVTLEGSLVLSNDELTRAASGVDKKLQEAIHVSAENIKKFHTAQKLSEKPVETMQGVTCFRQARPIEKVGLYIPGGTAPLFSSVLMLGIPAQLAGCKEIVLVTPPTQDGTIHPAVAYSAICAGVTKVVLVGGAQAIAALTYGTESVPKVYKIFGPGNRYVTIAKLLAASQGTAIDMPAGPSEVMVVADDGADYRVVAQDLLSQAEHGADSQSIVVTDSKTVASKVFNYLTTESFGERNELIQESLKRSSAVYFSSVEDIVAFMNEYAPEHLIIARRDPEDWVPRITNAGSVFLGYLTPESVGDYASGTNHTLPTNGWAKMYSGVNLTAYTKEITFQELTQEGLENLGDAVECMAEAEGLNFHKQAVAIRRADNKKS